MARRRDATCSARVIERINGCALQPLSTAPMNRGTAGRAPPGAVGGVPFSLLHGMPLRIALLVGLVSTAALAQAPTAVPPTAPIPPPTQFQPKVEDPLLAPVPPAPRQVGTWDEAL